MKRKIKSIAALACLFLMSSSAIGIAIAHQSTANGQSAVAIRYSSIAHAVPPPRRRAGASDTHRRPVDR